MKAGGYAGLGARVAGFGGDGLSWVGIVGAGRLPSLVCPSGVLRLGDLLDIRRFSVGRQAGRDGCIGPRGYMKY